MCETFENIISDTITSLINNKNYPGSERLKMRQCFNVNTCAARMYPKILPLVTNHYQSGNIDNFYMVCYVTFLVDVSIYIADELPIPI